MREESWKVELVGLVKRGRRGKNSGEVASRMVENSALKDALERAAQKLKNLGLDVEVGESSHEQIEVR